MTHTGSCDKGLARTIIIRSRPVFVFVQMLYDDGRYLQQALRRELDNKKNGDIGSTNLPKRQRTKKKTLDVVQFDDAVRTWLAAMTDWSFDEVTKYRGWLRCERFTRLGLPMNIKLEHQRIQTFSFRKGV